MPPGNSGIENRVLTFVQRCQVLTGNWASQDILANTAALWRCLSSVPPPLCELERSVIARAICVVAEGALSRTREGPTSNSSLPQATRSARSSAILAVQSVRWRHNLEGVSLAHIVNSMGGSYWHVSHLIKEHTGLRFSDHLAGWRLLSAVGILEKTDLSVKEVAAALGYSGTASFDRQFKRWIRMSPTQFRAAALPWRPCAVERLRQRPLTIQQSTRAS